MSCAVWWVPGKYSVFSCDAPPVITCEASLCHATEDTISPARNRTGVEVLSNAPSRVPL